MNLVVNNADADRPSAGDGSAGRATLGPDSRRAVGSRRGCRVAKLGERLLGFAPALYGYDDSSELVALSEHKLLDITVVELTEQRAEVAHGLADGAQLVGTDAYGGRIAGHDAGT